MADAKIAKTRDTALRAEERLCSALEEERSEQIKLPMKRPAPQQADSERIKKLRTALSNAQNAHNKAVATRSALAGKGSGTVHPTTPQE